MLRFIVTSHMRIHYTSDMQLMQLTVGFCHVTLLFLPTSVLVPGHVTALAEALMTVLTRKVPFFQVHETQMTSLGRW